MINGSNVSLVMIETKHHDLGTAALRQWTNMVNFGEVVTLSNRPLIQGARHITINPLTSKRDYADIMIRGLWPFVKTDYIMLVNWDTLPRNEHNWTPEFEQYDHIGSMWPWQAPRTNNANHCGMSWRSSKLLDAMRFPTVQAIDETTPAHISDVLNKTMVQKFNLKIADTDMNRKLCAELDYVDDGKSFAMRGLWHIINLYPKTVAEFYVINAPKNLYDELRPAYEVVAALVNQNHLDLLEKIADTLRESASYDGLMAWLNAEQFAAKNSVLRILK